MTEGPAGQLEAQVEARKYQNLQAAQEAADLQFVLADPRGRRALYRIIFRVAGAETLSYSEQNDRTNFREGRRDVGLTLIMEAQELFPDLYLEMLSEAIRDAADRTRRTKRIQEEANARSDGPDGN